MNKTPDEIKDGIKCCTIYLGGGDTGNCCDVCPYLGSCRELKPDALAYIQQLESDKQQLEGLLNHMNQLRDAAAGRALKMEERVKQLERERDAAAECISKLMVILKTYPYAATNGCAYQAYCEIQKYVENMRGVKEE